MTTTTVTTMNELKKNPDGVAAEEEPQRHNSSDTLNNSTTSGTHSSLSDDENGTNFRAMASLLDVSLGNARVNGSDNAFSRVKPGPKPGGSRKPRTVFSELQMRVLTENFEKSPYPSEHDVKK